MAKKSERKKRNQRERKLRLEYEEIQAKRIRAAKRIREEQEKLAEELAEQKVVIPTYRRDR